MLFKNIKKDFILKFFIIIPLIVGLFILIGLGFLDIFIGLKFLDTATAIGPFISGVAAFIAILFGGSFWLQKRSDAAAQLLSVFNVHLSSMIEIMQNPDIYQYEGYYPFLHPETRTPHAIRYWERPCRLIYNQFGLLKKELALQSTFFKGENFDRLLELEMQVEKIVQEINDWLALKLGNQPEKDLILQNYDNYDNFAEYKQQLLMIAEQAKELLSPLI